MTVGRHQRDPTRSPICPFRSREPRKDAGPPPATPDGPCEHVQTSNLAVGVRKSPFGFPHGLCGCTGPRTGSRHPYTTSHVAGKKLPAWEARVCFGRFSSVHVKKASQTRLLHSGGWPVRSGNRSGVLLQPRGGHAALAGLLLFTDARIRCAIIPRPKPFILIVTI